MSAGATLLAIDDEPGILAMVDRFAQRFGFEVVTRTDARAGLAEMPALKPAAVMVDLKMPEVNGLDVLRAIRDIDPTCQVILMTGQLIARGPKDKHLRFTFKFRDGSELYYNDQRRFGQFGSP